MNSGENRLCDLQGLFKFRNETDDQFKLSGYLQSVKCMFYMDFELTTGEY